MRYFISMACRFDRCSFSNQAPNKFDQSTRETLRPCTHPSWRATQHSCSRILALSRPSIFKFKKIVGHGTVVCRLPPIRDILTRLDGRDTAPTLTK